MLDLSVNVNEPQKLMDCKVDDFDVLEPLSLNISYECTVIKNVPICRLRLFSWNAHHEVTLNKSWEGELL